MTSNVLQARARKAVAVRQGDAAAVETASRDLAAAKLEQYIERVVAAAPPLSEAQKTRLAAIFRGGDAS
jgi:hypothetical protein